MLTQTLRCAAILVLGSSVTACASSPAPAYDLTSTSEPTRAAPLALSALSTTSAAIEPSITPTFTPTSTPTPSPVPTVESLAATVTADLLSCRYGPGANYLFLYGLRKDANIKLIGRTDGENWHWVYVDGAHKCWVNASFIQIKGDLMGLPIVYPGIAKLPVSPYYRPTIVLSAARNGNKVTIEWSDIPLRAGDEEDALMQHYIVEVWRCEGGHVLFEPLATNALSLTFTDDAGCPSPSHGRIFVQEKHGFAGPTELHWLQAN